MAQDQIEKFFAALQGSLKDEKHAVFGRGGDLHLLPSHVEFGIPTGMPQLDYAIGADGWPAGRIVELYGFEMCGKTALSLIAAAQVMRKGGTVLWIETEHTFDPGRAEAMGVNLDQIGVAEVDSIEAVFRICDNAIIAADKAKMDSPILIITDSITAVGSERELAKKMEKLEQLGLEPKIIKRGMKRLHSLLAKTNITALFVNHSIATMNQYGPKSRSGGGHALKFYASVRVQLSHHAYIKGPDKELRIGQEINITVDKLKNSEVRDTTFRCNLIKGCFNPTESLLDAMVESEQVKRRGPAYVLDDSVFRKADWADLVRDRGGYEKMYERFIETCIASGQIQRWGDMDAVIAEERPEAEIKEEEEEECEE